MTAFPSALVRVFPALLVALVLCACGQMPMSASGSGASPSFQVDPAWPQPLAETKDGVQQIFGQVAGIAVDPRNGHVWAIHRPASLLADVTHRRCVAAPHVVEFDAQGRLPRA